MGSSGARTTTGYDAEPAAAGGSIAPGAPAARSNRALAALACGRSGSAAIGAVDAALARAAAVGVPISNRAVARTLQRLWDRPEDRFADGGAFDDVPVPAPAQAAAPGQTAAPAPAAAGPAPALSAFRQEIVATGLSLVPASEGDAKFISCGDDPATLAKARAEHPGFTTCIDFQGAVIAKASTKAKGKEIHLSGILAHGQFPKAWHAATVNMTDRPRPGDVYVLHKVKAPDKFSHTGIIKEVVPSTDGSGVETWRTIDGGQGQKGVKEMYLEGTRYFHPDTLHISGEKNQGDTDALLFGWTDVDAI
jgi:hypothetical protein